MQTTDTTGGLDLRGWDTVSAVRISDLNRAIQQAGTTPPGFRHTYDERGSDITAAADFTTWKILPDGDGDELKMEIPLENVTVEARGQQTACGEGIALVTVRLELLPTNTMAEPGARKHVLVLAEPTERKPITVDKVELADGGWSEKLHCQTALSLWLNANIRTFTHVFAAVTLYDVLDETSDFSWLKPTHTAYAFGRNARHPERSILAVLAMTQQRSPSGLTFQVDPDLITASENAAYAIARPRVLHQMIRDGLPLAFPGLKLSDLTVNEDTKTISLKPGKGPTLDNVESEGKTYDVKLQKLVVTVYETSIKVESETKTKMFLGVYSVCSSSATYKIAMINAPDGSKRVGFELVEQSEPEHRTEITDGRKDVKKWLFIVAGIIALIGLVIAGIIMFALATPAALVTLALAGKVAAAAVMALILAGAGMSLQEWLLGDDGPVLDFLAMNAVAAIAWSTGTMFTPRIVDLNGVLQISGIFDLDPHIDTLSQGNEAAAFQAEFADFMQKRAA
jgi:hypothetical protein